MAEWISGCGRLPPPDTPVVACWGPQVDDDDDGLGIAERVNEYDKATDTVRAVWRPSVPLYWLDGAPVPPKE